MNGICASSLRTLPWRRKRFSEGFVLWRNRRPEPPLRALSFQAAEVASAPSGHDTLATILARPGTLLLWLQFYRSGRSL
jgi:hypothetical protein